MASRFRWTLSNPSNDTSQVLSKDPIGWEDVSLVLERHKLYHGVFIDYSLFLKWHCNGGGKEFIDSVYENEDVNGSIEVLIEIDCDQSGTYTEFYRGRLDLAGYKKETDFTTCAIEKSDLYTKLITRDEISVDLESATSIGGETITVPETVDLPIAGMEIEVQSEWVIEDDYAYSFIENSSDGEGFGIYHVPLGALTFDEILTSYGMAEWTQLENSTFEFSNTTELLLANEGNIDYPLTIDYDIDIAGTFTDNQTIGGAARTNFECKLMLAHGIKDPNITPSLTFITLFDASGYSSDPYSTNFNVAATGSFTLPQGHSVWIFWRVSYEDAPGEFTVALEWVYDRSTIRFTSITTSPATQTKAILVHEAFNQVIDSIADTDYKFYSDFYGRTDSQKLSYGSDGCGSKLAITSGLNIREFANKQIFCSLRDLFKTFHALHNIGLTIERYESPYVGEIDTVRVERLSHFYDNTTEIISLSHGVNVTTTLDNTLYYNRAVIGYDKWETEYRGGLDEPCSKHEYSTKVNAIKGEYQRLSKYMASSYAIELTRRKNQLFTKEDWRYDNENFLFALTRTVYGGFAVELLDDAFGSGTGMTAINTAYNLRLTPARMLLAHIHSIFACLQTIRGAIKFVSGEGNTALETSKTDVGCQEDYSGAGLAENDSIDWNETNAANVSPLWLPEVYEFEYPLSLTEINTIRDNPHGYITVTDAKGQLLKGFILKIDYKLKTGLTRFRLLRMFESCSNGSVEVFGAFSGTTITVTQEITGLHAGDEITITGSASNDGTYTVTALFSGESSSTIHVEENLITEAFVTFTITGPCLG